MRTWITIVCAIALLLYVGWVLDDHQRQAGGQIQAGMPALEGALVKAGGSLDAAQFTLVAPITDPAVPGRVQERLGWTGAPPRGEQREARLYTDQGMYYLALNWRLTGEQAARWAEAHAALEKALLQEGVTTPSHVQIEGTAKGQDLMAMAHAALDSLSASERQPWSGTRSASVAGRSDHLPKGPHAVNIQVAARESGKSVKLWVAWPALTGDY